MPKKNTFLIKDILGKSNNDTFTTSADEISSSFEYNNLFKQQQKHQQLPYQEIVSRDKREKHLNENLVEQTTNNEKFINSLISMANQNQQSQDYLSSLSLENITDLYLKSPQSSSSSSSLSSTSPILSSSSSSTNQISHEQLVNQFYQRLLFLNLQNSLNRIQSNNVNLLQQQQQQGFPIKQSQQLINNNKENASSNENFCNTNENNNNNSDYEALLNHNQQLFDERKHNSYFKNDSKFHPYKKPNKSCSSSSLKISGSSDIGGEFDESNSDNHSNGNCSTPIDSHNSNSNVSPLDALLQMANTTYFNANNNTNMMTSGRFLLFFLLFGDKIIFF